MFPFPFKKDRGNCNLTLQTSTHLTSKKIFRKTNLKQFMLCDVQIDMNYSSI